MARKQSNRIIRVYRRNVFGVLVCIDRFCAYTFEAVISTHGALRVCYCGDKSIHKAYAAGEWHVVDNFKADYSAKV
jgi:hypothetical protein